LLDRNLRVTHPADHEEPPVNVWLWPESRPWYPGTQVKCEPWGPLSRHHRACAYPSPAASDFPLQEEYSVSPCRRMQQLSKNGSGEKKGNISHNDAGSVGTSIGKTISAWSNERRPGEFLDELGS